MLLSSALIQQSIARYHGCDVDRQTRSKAVTKDGNRGHVIQQAKRKAIYRELMASTNNAQAAASALERIIAGNDLTGINYLAIGLRASRSVCRICLRDSAGRLTGYGTGFLVAPGVLMTNNHVLDADTTASTATAEFNYEFDVDGHDRPVIRFALDATSFFTDKKLDFSLVGVAPRAEDGTAITEFGFLPLRPRPGKSFEGEYLTIVQHPGGERKQICVRENKLIKYLEDTVWYETDTVAGSSGSPVFNGFWEVVALHHSGVPQKKNGRIMAADGKPWDETMGEDKIKWIANEGIRASSIVSFLQGGHAQEPLARRVLDASAPGAANLITPPARLPVVPNQPHVWQPSAPGLAPPMAAPITSLPGIEKVVINQNNYDERPGYDENFLGDGALKLPLPTLPAKLKTDAVRLTDAKTEMVLNYYNYSLVMSKSRKLAFYSMVNINGAQRRDTGKREGDKWFFDPRIPAGAQIDDKFYKAVKTAKNPKVRVFDRGHLVRRLDATWGPNVSQATRNGNDTFHFTNCSPQHLTFNESKALWAGIEDFVLDHAQNEKCSATVINGPVFGTKDPSAQGIKIPVQFFKIAVFAKADQLAAAGFLLTQADLLERDLPEDEKLSVADAKVFQVPIKKIAALTGLGFGPLTRRDGGMDAFEEMEVLQPLGGLQNIMI